MEHKTLKIDEFEVHYYMTGSKEKDLIIFLHPAFSDHRAFDQQIDYFAREYRVMTIDLIGHGLSKAKKSKDKIDASSKHINELLKIEGYEKAHLVGVSLGSLIAQYFAFEYPNSIKSLTALGGYSIHEVNKDIDKVQKSVNIRLICSAIFSMKSFRHKIATMTCNSKVGQALFYESASHYERKSFLVMQGLQNVVKDREIEQPKYSTLMLTGEFELELAIQMAIKWHKEIVNSKYLMIDNAGHCANMDRPKAFNRIVKEFIDANND